MGALFVLKQLLSMVVWYCAWYHACIMSLLQPHGDLHVELWLACEGSSVLVAGVGTQTAANFSAMQCTLWARATPRHS